MSGYVRVPTCQFLCATQVYGLPTLILFKDGAEVAGSKREGAVTKPMLLSYLKQHGLVA